MANPSSPISKIPAQAATVATIVRTGAARLRISSNPRSAAGSADRKAAPLRVDGAM